MAVGVYFNFFYLYFLMITHLTSSFLSSESQVPDLLILTVATNETDGFRRFLRSTQVYNLNVKVLGMGQPWLGGNVAYDTGGGQKVNLLKEALEEYKELQDLIILFTDSYDVIFTAGAEEIVKKFLKNKARVLFSAEGFCWPESSLHVQYPPVQSGKRFLNSGGFMGYAPELYRIVTSSPIKNADDDQLFYTKVFLDENLRRQLNIKLDNKAEIFQTLNGATGEVTLKFKNGEAFLYNTAFGSMPVVIHANGPRKIKIALNTFGNYLARSWSPEKGCISCKEDTFSLRETQKDDWPLVFLGLFIPRPTPFVSEFLRKIGDLNYPKEKLDVLLYNKIEYHNNDVEEFVKGNKNKYRSFKVIRPEDGIAEKDARNFGIQSCISMDCPYYFVVDSEAILDNPNSLRFLIEQNRSFIAPMMTRPMKLWSNFWGALSDDGYYARSVDYVEIVQNNKRGVWNVPFVSITYLMHGSMLKKHKPTYVYERVDPDMSFCINLRELGVFTYITNRDYYGHLINCDTFNTSLKNADLYEIFNNRLDWDTKYIHPDYREILKPETEIEMPCPDVYWFPVTTPIFCQHLIETMENNGEWSNGTNKDERLAGGYENVPTRDIHMVQVGMELQWLFFLREYIRPIQEKVYPGYFHDPPISLMNFVVRYKPDEQPNLRPHHDSSTYTINLALNKPHIDYEGGGCHFIRYNCSIIATRLGWTMMHPGRLTHYHEGLDVIKGTRYIMISFVDP